MATVKGPASKQELTFEVTKVTLEDGELDELRADPEAFTRKVMGEDFVINSMYLGENIATDDDCVDLEHMHGLSPENISQSIWVCRHQE